MEDFFIFICFIGVQYQQCLNLLWLRGISFHPSPARPSFPARKLHCFAALWYAPSIGLLLQMHHHWFRQHLPFYSHADCSCSFLCWLLCFNDLVHFHLNRHLFVSVNQLELMQYDRWWCVVFEFNAWHLPFFGDSPMGVLAFNRTSILLPCVACLHDLAIA